MSRSRKKNLAVFLWVLPPQKQFFFSTPGSSRSFAKIAEYAGQCRKYCKTLCISNEMINNYVLEILQDDNFGWCDEGN